MSYYYKLGNIPPKRHTQFRQPDGGLYYEELVSSIGFDGIYSNLYHTYPPTKITKVLESYPMSAKTVENFGLKPIHIKTSSVKRTGHDFLESRKVVLKNGDVEIAICNPSAYSMDYYYKNGECDEILFLHEGNGWLISQFGKLRMKKGDYVVIPRTTIYRVEFDTDIEPRLLVIESRAPIETVDRYRNQLGQLLEHSPYCERDMHPPQEIVAELGERETLVKIKKGGYIHQLVYAHSPLDLVGWDGFLYPYTFSIYDFEPLTGRIHMPPPIHQTFQSRGGFVICSFVPRLFDYHPLAIPAPYNHSNIDSDEVLFYVEGEFMSRKGIDTGSFTIHPGGITHGPHPGTAEKSIGVKDTFEYAVMIDTFKPLFVTEDALEFVDENYPLSWL